LGYGSLAIPKETPTKHEIDVSHLGAFLIHVLDPAPYLVCAAAKKLREGLRLPPLAIKQYFKSLERQRLPQTVSAEGPSEQLH
jgi:hypothetical protein